MHQFLVTNFDPINNQPVLRALEYGIIILLWLFFMWVVRAVWVEVRPLKARQRRRGADAAVVAAPVPGAPGLPGSGGGGGRARRGKQLRLHVIRPEELAGRVYDLDGEVTVGRAAGCGVSVDYDTYASNLHARLFRADGDLWVEDLGSTNGTWVNAERLEHRARLGKGDLLQVGGTVFEIGK